MKRRKYILGLVISMNLLMVTLTACASKEAEEAKAAETVTEEAAVEEAMDTAEAEEAGMETTVDEVQESVAETTLEQTEEPESEPVVYEGIDMESTLPAEEWIMTFIDIINEPKFVVTNSETNKKVIVEEGQKVVLEEGDVLGVYVNDGAVVGYSGIHVIEDVDLNNFYEELKLDTFTEETKFEVKISSPEGKKWISCILVPNN